MKMEIDKDCAIQRINEFYSNSRPFIFVASYDCQRNIVMPLDEIDPSIIQYDVQGITNAPTAKSRNNCFKLKKNPKSYLEFRKHFDFVHKHLALGNTYLLNLTQPTRIDCNYSLSEIFQASQARYKLWIRDQFVVFSPEIFVQIEDEVISSNPMKGTIDANIDDAASTLLENQKEMAEHVTIVDLIRNDMSVFACNVEVSKFRYIDEVRTHEKRLLQASSQIQGQIKKEMQGKIGQIIYSLLPAGSISGAPKPKTLEIINEAEGYDRGYYTGVFGIFDGKRIDSGVMIRFIEQTNDGLIYKSGGGIHFLSDSRAEYQELIDKVYVPLH